VLLGGLVTEKGVQAVADDVRGMMVELEVRCPDQRERSLIASVKLSLRILPDSVKEKLRGLAVFYGSAYVGVIAHVLQVDQSEALDLGRKLMGANLSWVQISVCRGVPSAKHPGVPPIARGNEDGQASA